MPKPGDIRKCSTESACGAAQIRTAGSMPQRHKTRQAIRLHPVSGDTPDRQKPHIQLDPKWVGGTNKGGWHRQRWVAPAKVSKPVRENNPEQMTSCLCRTSQYPRQNPTNFQIPIVEDSSEFYNSGEIFSAETVPLAAPAAVVGPVVVGLDRHLKTTESILPAFDAIAKAGC